MNETTLENLVNELRNIAARAGIGTSTSGMLHTIANQIEGIHSVQAKRNEILQEILKSMDHTVKDHVYPGQDASIEGVVKQYADRIRTEVLGEPDQRLSAFLAEYEALCRKHMLVIDGVYHGTVAVWDLGKADVDALLTLIRDQIMEHGIKVSEEEFD